MRSNARNSLLALGSAVVFLVPGLLRISHGALGPYGESSFSLFTAHGIFPWMVQQMIGWLGSSIGPVLLTSVLGGIAMLLLLQLFNKVKLTPQEQLLALSITLVSPVMMGTFSTPQRDSLALVGLLLLTLANLEQWWVVGIFAGFFIGAESATLGILALLVIAVFSKRNAWRSVQGIGVIVGYVAFLPTVTWGHGILDALRSIIAELGNARGMSAMLFAVAIISMPIVWRRREQYAGMLWAASPIFLMPLLGKPMGFVALFGIAGIAAVGIAELLRRPWESRGLQQLTALIIICGILFSVITFLTGALALPPRMSEQRALAYIATNAGSDTKIFADPSQAAMVEALAHVQVGTVVHAPGERREVERMLEQLQSTENPLPARQLMLDHDITILFLTPGIDRSYPWAQSVKLTTAKKFTNLYADGQVTVWALK